jgi:pyruvate/2-oxoglutarate dehydrogenase complex dihydrolipoamide dehydrogenase (E3) component
MKFDYDLFVIGAGSGGVRFQSVPSAMFSQPEVATVGFDGI